MIVIIKKTRKICLKQMCVCVFAACPSSTIGAAAGSTCVREWTFDEYDASTGAFGDGSTLWYTNTNVSTRQENAVWKQYLEGHRGVINLHPPFAQVYLYESIRRRFLYFLYPF